MSYARFSSDDFQSDVYVYGAEGGVTVHVANQKPIIDRSSLPPQPSTQDPAWSEKWTDRYAQLSKLLESCKYEPLTIPNAGESWDHLTHAEAAQLLLDLQDTGAYVPAGTIDALLSMEDSDG